MVSSKQKINFAAAMDDFGTENAANNSAARHRACSVPPFPKGGQGDLDVQGNFAIS